MDSGSAEKLHKQSRASLLSFSGESEKGKDSKNGDSESEVRDGNPLEVRSYIERPEIVLSKC